MPKSAPPNTISAAEPRAPTVMSRMTEQSPTKLMFGIDPDPDYQTDDDDRTLHEMPHLTDI